MLFNPGVAEMAEYARSVWLAAHGASQGEQEAVAWMIKNRLLAVYQPGAWQGYLTNPLEQQEFLAICKGFVDEESSILPCVRGAPVSFDDMQFCRAFSTICLVWNGDVDDVTGGAVRCHGHNEALDWAAALVPSALIGSRFFYATE